MSCHPASSEHISKKCPTYNKIEATERRTRIVPRPYEFYELEYQTGCIQATKLRFSSTSVDAQNNDVSCSPLQKALLLIQKLYVIF